MNYKSFPKGYRQIDRIDFVRNPKQLKIVAIASLGSAILMIALGLFIQPLAPTWNLLKHNWLVWILPIAMYIAYIFLHELTHGIFMYALSGVKPKYGLSLCYAYAGSRAYFDKSSHNLIALAPLVLWGIVLFILGELLPEEWFWLIFIIQISNISGSTGDIYCVAYLAKLPEDIIIQDAGTQMRIFAPQPVKEDSK